MSLDLLPPYDDIEANGKTITSEGIFNIQSGDPHDTDYCEVGENCEECVTCAGDPCTSCPTNTHDTLKLTLSGTEDCDGEWCFAQDATNPCLFNYPILDAVEGTIEYTGTGDSRQIEITLNKEGVICAHSIISPITCDPRMGVVNDVVGGVSDTAYLVLTVADYVTPPLPGAIPAGIYHAEQVVGNPFQFIYDSGGLKITIDWPNYAGDTWHVQNPYIVMAISVEYGGLSFELAKMGVLEFLPFNWSIIHRLPTGNADSASTMVISAPNGTLTLESCCTPPEPPDDHPPAGGCCCDCQPNTLSVIISGTGTVVDGSWTVTFAEDCLWTFTNAEVELEVGKSGDTLTVIAHDVALNIDRFNGSASCLCVNDGACNGTCFESNFDITNTLGTGTATVSGSCTPQLEGFACAETWECGDTPPCSGCCPNAIPTSLLVTASGITACGGCISDGLGNCYEITGISISATELERNGSAACGYGPNPGGAVIGTLSYKSGIASGPPPFGTCTGACTNSGTSPITCRIVAGVVIIRSLSGNVVLFMGALDEICTGVATNQNTGSQCGTVASAGGMWMAHSGSVTADCP